MKLSEFVKFLVVAYLFQCVANIDSVNDIIIDRASFYYTSQIVIFLVAPIVIVAICYLINRFPPLSLLWIVIYIIPLALPKHDNFFFLYETYNEPFLMAGLFYLLKQIDITPKAEKWVATIVTIITISMVVALIVAVNRGNTPIVFENMVDLDKVLSLHKVFIFCIALLSYAIIQHKCKLITIANGLLLLSVVVILCRMNLLTADWLIMLIVSTLLILSLVKLNGNEDVVLGAILLFVIAGSILLPENYVYSNGFGMRIAYITTLVLLLLYCMSIRGTILYPTQRTKRVLFYGLSLLAICYTIFALFPYTNINSTEVSIYIVLIAPILWFLLYNNEKRVIQIIAISSLIFLAVALVLLGSRTAMIAFAVESVVFLLLSKKLNRKWRVTLYILLPLLVVATLLCNTDSLEGRLNIWRVSLNMFADNPILGKGRFAYVEQYMDYQTAFLEMNSGAALLADEISNPLNEYIHLLVKYGLVGFIMVIASVVLALRLILKRQNRYMPLSLSALLGLAILSLSSYPFHYIGTLLLLGLYLCLGINRGRENKNNTVTLNRWIRVALVLISIVLLRFDVLAIRDNIRWQEAVGKNKLNTMYMYSSMQKNPYFLYSCAVDANKMERYDLSVEFMQRPNSKICNYSSQLLLVDNYFNLRQYNKAEECYIVASKMLPCRIAPKYLLFSLYRESNQLDKAMQYAEIVVNHSVKVPSADVELMKNECQRYIELQNR